MDFYSALEFILILKYVRIVNFKLIKKSFHWIQRIRVFFDCISKI